MLRAMGVVATSNAIAGGAAQVLFDFIVLLTPLPLPALRHSSRSHSSSSCEAGRALFLRAGAAPAAANSETSAEARAVCES